MRCRAGATWPSASAGWPEVLTAAALVPTPPLLVPEVAGGSAGRDDDLRDACDAALAVLLASGAERLVVLAAAEVTGPVDGTWDWRGFGVASPARPAAARLPLGLAIGSWLLDRAGDRRPRTAFGVAPADAARAGARLVAGAPTGLLVCGDGSARRDEKAPGHLDPRAGPFDERCGSALASGDPGEVLRLDADLGRALLSTGVPAWWALAGAAGAACTAELTYTAAPYGVGYVVGTWLPRPD